jgi:hypothetical protein
MLRGWEKIKLPIFMYRFIMNSEMVPMMSATLFFSNPLKKHCPLFKKESPFRIPLRRGIKGDVMHMISDYIFKFWLLIFKV